MRGSSSDSSTNTDFTTSNPASTCPRLHPCPALHPLPSRHEDQPDRAKLSCRDQASSASDKRRLAVWSSSKACISKGPQILAGLYCYLLIQVLIVEFQQEPGTVEIEFTAVTSSPGQAAVCRVRVEVKNKIKSLFTSGTYDTQPSLRVKWFVFAVKYFLISR